MRILACWSLLDDVVGVVDREPLYVVVDDTGVAEVGAHVDHHTRIGCGIEIDSQGVNRIIVWHLRQACLRQNHILRLGLVPLSFFGYGFGRRLCFSCG